MKWETLNTFAWVTIGATIAGAILLWFFSGLRRSLQEKNFPSFIPKEASTSLLLVFWIGFLVLEVMLFFFSWNLFQAINAVLVFLFFGAPLYAPLFLNEPDPEKKTNLGPVFTKVERGQAKAVVRFGEMVNLYMNLRGYETAGQIYVDGEPLTEVVEELGEYQTILLNPGAKTVKTDKTVKKILEEKGIDYEDITVQGDNVGHPLSPLYWWKSYLKIFEIYFGGIEPWQGFYGYPVTKLREVVVKEVVNGVEITTRKFVESRSWSDHVRVRSFIWYIQFQDPVELAGGIPVKPFFALSMRSIDPEKTLWGTDNWPDQTTNMAQNRVNTISKVLSPEVLLAATLENARNPSDLENLRHELEMLLVQLNPDLAPYGLEIISAEIKAQGTEALSDVDKPALTARWRAKQNAEADYITTTREADAESYTLDNKLIKLESHGELGRRVLETEAQVETAQKGRATYIVGEGGGKASQETALLISKIDELISALGEKNAPKGGKK